MAVLVRSGARRSRGCGARWPRPVSRSRSPATTCRWCATRRCVPLLDALRAVVNLDNDDPDHADYLDPGRAEALLLSPLGGLDAADVRALLRRLAHAREGRGRRAAAAHVARAAPARGRGRLPRRPRGPRRRPGRGARRPAARRRAELDAAGRREEVLWTLWSGTAWPQRLRRPVDAGGASARRANRDLDSIVALFDAAARAEEQREHVGVRSFLATLVAQQIPADTLAERGVRGRRCGC